MYFRHSPEIWRAFPELVPGVLTCQGITSDVEIAPCLGPFLEIARQRLDNAMESEFPEIYAWRRAFSKMGLKPTQYRCASESLLRRFRKESSLPQLHPLIDLCNAISLAFGVPVAVIDVDRIVEGIEVRHATGNETYQTFSGEIEQPEPGEVIFADGKGQAHARRWTNRQSGLSAVSDATSSVLIVSEAMHENASADMARLIRTLTDELEAVWSVTPATAVLTPSSPVYEF